MNNFKVYIILMSCFAWLTACDQGEEVDTNQLGSPDVTLESFGPSPIPRGAELRIIGTHLDGVESVILQGSGSINDIKRISTTEIRITVPQNALQGIIQLKAGDQVVTSISELTFEETISIASVAPLTVKAGDTIKIEGDYLNLIEEIIFVDNVHVLKDDFKSQSRSAIEVVVPVATQSGKVIVSNGADLFQNASGEVGIPVWVYSEEELTVALPVASKVTPNPVKAGSTLTIEGQDLDLVERIVFTDNIDGGSFISHSETKIEIKVPTDAKEGIVQLVAFSGVKVDLPDSLILIMPDITSITPNPAKNGSMLTVAGTNLDLISRVVFGGGKEATMEKGGTDTKIQVQIPIDAIEGKISFFTLAEKEIQSAELKLVKPTITSINPTTIIAGEAITIKGKDLDLVTKIILGGNTIGNILSQSETELSVESLPNSLTDLIILETANGTQVKSVQEITINSDLPVITALPSSIKPGEKLTLDGTKLNMVESIIFEDGIKASKYGLRSETVIEVYVPENAKKGIVTLTLHTYDGKEVQSPSFTISGTDPVTDPSYVFFDFDGKNSWWGTYGAPGNDPALTLSGNYYRINQDLPSGWVDFFWRNGRDNFKTDGVTVADWVIKMDVNVLGVTTPEFKFRLNGTDGDFWALIPGMSNRGGWYTVTIPLTNFYDNGGTGTNQLPNVQNINADFGMAANAAGPANICIDNIRFDRK